MTATCPIPCLLTVASTRRPPSPGVVIDGSRVRCPATDHLNPLARRTVWQPEETNPAVDSPAVTTTIAIVPLRSPGHGKTRLAGSLRPEHRAALAAAMFADVICALRAAPVDGILVAASGPEAVAAASALGVEAHIDPSWVTDLNGAIGAAAATLDASCELMVVAADLPRLTGGDVVSILTTDAEVVLAPTTDGGTGGLLRRPADRIPTAYGPGSAAQHCRLAADAGATYIERHTAGFRDDVDIDADLTGLRRGPVGPATSKLLAGWTDLTDLAG